MAFAFVQTKDNAQLTSAITNVITPSSAITAGNLVVVNVRLSTGGLNINSVTDNKGNTYAQAATSTLLGSTTANQYQYYGVQITGGATTVTVTLNISGTSRAVMDEYSGGASTNASVFDKSSIRVSSTMATSATVTSFSPTSAGELIVAGLMLSTAVTAITAGAGYIIANNVETTIGTQYNLSSSTTETAPISWTSTSTWTELAGAYIPATTTVTGYHAGLFAGTQFAYSSFSNAYGSIGSTAVQDTIELLLTGVG